jgi:hypothetical protein
MVSRDLVPMRESMRRGTIQASRPLQIAVDGVPGTTEAMPGGFNRAIGGG